MIAPEESGISRDDERPKYMLSSESKDEQEGGMA
jgi:hypothetical protein